MLRLSKQRIVPGFIGEVTYRCDAAPVMARFTTLLRMAEFLGAGARTEYGFGHVRVGNAQPPTPSSGSSTKAGSALSGATARKSRASIVST